MVDVVYIAASAHDARFTRICVASVRRFYPDVPIRLLVGGPLQRGLERELRHYWSVGTAELPRGDYGWGFVKLEPLFLEPGQRFLVLDSDTVMTGPVLDRARENDADFIVDDETQSDEKARGIYYDWRHAGKDGGPTTPPAFLFNSGQWFGRSGLLTREHFQGLVKWGWPPRLIRPEIFKNGEQGVLNFVLNEQERQGTLRTARVRLMCWPGQGMQELDVASVSSGSCPPLVIHWAGMKQVRHRDMPGADVLGYYERRYYERLPAGSVRRVVNSYRNALARGLQLVRARVRVRMGR
jgi:hypothetical protein